MDLHEPADPEIAEASILASTEQRGDRTLGDRAHEFLEGVLYCKEVSIEGLTTKEILRLTYTGIRTRILMASREPNYLRRRSES